MELLAWLARLQPGSAESLRGRRTGLLLRRELTESRTGLQPLFGGVSFFSGGCGLLRPCLESRELGPAAHGHHAHLARAVDRYHHGYPVAALEKRDVADFRAAHRQVEYGPGVGA